MPVITDEQAQAIFDKLSAELPPIFSGSKIDDLTGGAICWGTTQNRRSKGEIPNEDEIFIRSGNRVLVVRDPFLRWWVPTLLPARRPPVLPPRRERPDTAHPAAE